jgi:hypothetical protein
MALEFGEVKLVCSRSTLLENRWKQQEANWGGFKILALGQKNQLVTKLLILQASIVHQQFITQSYCNTYFMTMNSIAHDNL